jgi:hypothetical protein
MRLRTRGWIWRREEGCCLEVRLPLRRWFSLSIPTSTEIEYFDVRGPDGMAGTKDAIHRDLVEGGQP